MNIIELAEQAGLAYKTPNGKYWIDAGYPDIHLERFAELVAAAERESCAKLCEEKALYFQYDFIAPYDVADSCAEEIRARRDMSTKSQNVDISAERVHESDKSVHDLRKVAEMALQALCSANPIGHALEDYAYHNKATEALRQALAQPEQEPIDKMPTKIFGPNLEEILNAAGFYRLSEQKPKAWIYDGNLHIFDPTDWALEPESVQPLYPAPPSKPWVSLTDEEIDEAIESCKTTDTYKYFRAIEAALRSKNT